MRGRHEGLLKVIQTVPALNNLSYCQLHRLCMSSAGEDTIATIIVIIVIIRLTIASLQSFHIPLEKLF